MKPWTLVTLAAWCLLACGNEDDAGPAGSGGETGGSGAATGGSGGAGASGGGVSGGGGSSGGTSGASGGGGSGGGSGGTGGSAWPAPSVCDEGTDTSVCGNGVAEASCPDQVVLFSQTMQDTATAYWELKKPKGGFRVADKFAQGNAYLRFEVTSKPTNVEAFPQLCFWRWGPQVECKDRWKVFAETCSSGSAFSYTKTGVYYASLGSPSKWWQKASPAWNYGLPWDAIRILQKADHNGQKYLLQDGSCGSACWPVAGGAAAHMPIEIKAEVVLVAQGKSLQKPASWTGCAEPWCN
jgi:hypothetical protein